MPTAIARSVAGIVLAAAFAQAQPAAFEVASVRQNKLDDHIVTINVGPGGRFAARGYTLVLLIQRAYGVMDWNVTGGPDWIRTDRFDVTAKAAVGNLTEAQLQPMLQHLLAERFKLNLHRDTREMAGYALEVAKGVPKLKSTASENRDSFRMTGSSLTVQGIRMPDFARFLAGKLGLAGIDQTGLTGIYAIDLKWKSENDEIARDFPGYDPREPLRAAVFAALQEQLGLKFIAKRVVMPVLVIDHAERASDTEN